MQALFEIGLEVIKVLVGLAVAGSLAYFIAYRELARRAFWGRVTFTLISFKSTDPKRVVLDTLLDLGSDDVWVNNRLLLGKIRAAAEQCSDECPWLWMDGPTMYHVKSGIRHQLSSRFSDAAIAKAVGVPVEQTSLLTCLCAVHSKNSNSHKLRAFVFTKDVLRTIGEDVETWIENNPKKRELLQTVACLWKRYQEEPRNKPEECVLHTVRIYTPKVSA